MSKSVIYLSTALLTLIFVMCIDFDRASILISGPNRTYWKGCILQKIPLFTAKTDLLTPCHKCAMTRDPKLLVRRKGFPQRMYNCTEFCDRVTICTHSRYYNGNDSGMYPLCYECQNKKDEHITFNPIFKEEMCLEDCRNCSSNVDMSKAYQCAPHCRGLPTFCYPKVYLNTHTLCYQAEAFYGCDSEVVEAVENLSPTCKQCATEAKNQKEGRECANECGGLPTFSKPETTGGSKFYSCQKRRAVGHADLFFYEIPKFLLRHFHYSNPANLYMSEMVRRKEYLSGTIYKFMFTPFNMTTLTYPRPPGFEDLRKL